MFQCQVELFHPEALRRYESILKRLAASPTVTLYYWEHSSLPHNWGVISQPLDGKNQIFVNKSRFEHMDGLVLLQLMTGRNLQAISAQIALHDIALDPSALNSSLVTRVFYSLLPVTAAEQAASSVYPGIFQVLKRVEPSLARIYHNEESITADVVVAVEEGKDGADHGSGSPAPEENVFVRFWRAMTRPFLYWYLFRFLTTSPPSQPCDSLQLTCNLHRHWANLLSIDLEGLFMHNLASLRVVLANTAATAKKCCQDGSSGSFSLASLFSEILKFLKIRMSFKHTTPLISLVSGREIVSSLLYSAIFLICLYSFVFLYFDPKLLTVFSIFKQISSAIFYLGVAGCALLLSTKLFRIMVHKKLTIPLVSGHPIFSLLHDALLLRQSHSPLHPLLMSTEVFHESDGNIVAALSLQTPICAASSFLLNIHTAVAPEEDRALRRVGASLAGSARLALQNGTFPSVSVGSGGELIAAGNSLSAVMKDGIFGKLMRTGVLEQGHIAVDWWCGFSISGKRFSILHQLGLAPAINLLYISDQSPQAEAAKPGVTLAPHLPLHDSGPIGM